jgi:predicted metal-dependent peptidase
MMTTEDKIIKSKIKIQKNNSFFAYLSLYLKFREEKNLPECYLAGVDLKGNFIYRKESIDNLKSDELTGLIAHEILHLALLHLNRIEERDKELWNVACDIVVNHNLKENGFSLPKTTLITDYDGHFNRDGIHIKDIGKKTAEQVYKELLQNPQTKKALGSGEGSRFDEHIERKNDLTGKKLSQKEIKEISKEWTDKVREALTISKMRGDTPKGLQRIFEQLHKEKVNWKALLNEYITNQIPYSYTYAKPHKRSICVGEYMPDILKEKVEIVIGIDTSGSIGNKELVDFISEVVGIARGYQERIDMRIITHETRVNEDYEVKNGSIEAIKKLKISGGGGTSHKEIFEKVKKYNPQCAIFLTDGESDLDEIDFNHYPFKKLFLISEEGTDKQLKYKKCRVIHLGVQK